MVDYKSLFKEESRTPNPIQPKHGFLSLFEELTQLLNKLTSKDGIKRVVFDIEVGNGLAQSTQVVGQK